MILQQKLTLIDPLTWTRDKSFVKIFIKASDWRPLYFLVFPPSTKTRILPSSLFFVFYTRHGRPLKLLGRKNWCLSMWCLSIYAWYIHEICYGGKEKGNEINVILWIKIMGPRTCMYVMCIVILPRYVMLVRMHTFDIYVRHVIMKTFSFMRVQWYVLCCAWQSRPKGHVYKSIWWVHVCVRGPCVEKYHASNSAKNWKKKLVVVRNRLVKKKEFELQKVST